MKILAYSIVALAGAILWGFGSLSSTSGGRLGWSDGTTFGGIALCLAGVVAFIRAWMLDSKAER